MSDHITIDEYRRLTGKAARNKSEDREGQEQEIVFQWAKLNENRYPCLKWMHHIPNGGSRHPAEAAKLRRQGVTPGISDIFLPHAAGEYHGLYIEMKWNQNMPTIEQSAFLDFAARGGYKTAVCWSADEAIAVIEEYLNYSLK